MELLLTGLLIANMAGTLPKLEHFSLPQNPQAALDGGEVWLEAEAAAHGEVRSARVLRATSPFTAAVAGAVQSWTFAPAPADQVLKFSVIAVFRSATLVGSFMAQAQDVAQASPGLLLPAQTSVPNYPVTGLGDNVVLLEARGRPDGSPVQLKALSGAPVFVDEAIRTARTWRFAAAGGDETPSPRVAFLIFGFRAPVGVAPNPPKP